MFFLKSVFVSVVLLITITTALAKDLTQRLGVGVKQESMYGQLPTLLVQYHPTLDYTWVGAMGIDTQANASSTYLSFALRRNLFFEPQLNFYAAGRISFYSFDVATGAGSGFGLAALGGTEFFLQGLENLAFLIEAGLELSIVDSKSRMSTVGGAVTQAGAVFYF